MFVYFVKTEGYKPGFLFVISTILGQAHILFTSYKNVKYSKHRQQISLQVFSCYHVYILL